ncbi:ATP-dependent helicase HrpB [Pseudorhodobacter antarcticus]|uniref:ATP-dependent helicase HrpB n=1 Tax=Pseudorhodobacter antarcticus TaxID=1077947 RepID=A0A1H8ENQ8_9RHOB|nr:ATP-dependent helicase HrpB [Pseudorhodobacter antarcticus]SEN21026.1 ATP-dependent helicase HrpB [Pseudorhodobacter antarcticus]
MNPNDPLPIDEALPRLLDALRAHGQAVLQAPPGAGKTTRVPLAMLEAGLVAGRILMLEPRRLAARTSAERMAETLGEPVGQTVGYRVRGEAKVSRATRIEVVTEGILTRMIQSDPGLDGIGALIFDEFHERSLNADLGLALALEIRGALRDDLMILVMSATLDAAPVAALMGDAPLITSEGRAFAVETRWLARPLPPRARLEPEMAALIVQALEECPEGGLLAFLPGEGEIRRVEAALAGRLPPDCTVRPLFGNMPFADQRAALAPQASGRKIVLATAIAETSLTLPDIRVVVDGGRSRRARFDPNSGMSRLVTERVTKAEAEQRRGRAGRVAPGTCYRLWTKGEEGGMAAFPPAEIEAADLTPLVLELALWGSAEGLAFLTPPNPGVMAEAQALLASLGALHQGRITDHGRALAALPLHPRLGHMLQMAGGGPDAATLAAVLAERDPVRGAPPDLNLRLAAIANPRGFEENHPFAVDRGVVERIKAEAKRLKRGEARSAFSPGQLAALAYPDRVALRRKGDAPRFILSGGKGAVMEAGTPLAGHRLMIATDLDGDAREARIRQAAPITEAELRALFGPQIAWVDVCDWSRREGKVIARRQERFGALVLDDRVWPDAPAEAVARAAFDGLRLLGVPWTPAAARLRARVVLCREEGSDLPDLTDAALMDSADWLLPYLSGLKTEGQLRALDLTEALRALIGWDGMQLLDRLTPSHFTTPLDRRIPIDYDGEAPGIALRLQEMFGVTQHPTVGPKSLPLRVTLLSPGGSPLQTTMDLPGFWTNTYDDVRKDMRGRYPRHPWPDDPRVADPTLRAKPRGT